MPTLLAGADAGTVVHSNVLAAEPRLTGLISALSDLPASFSAGSVVGSRLRPFIRLNP
jgi:hypothetical protein